jgi:hypothetical protein
MICGRESGGRMRESGGRMRENGKQEGNRRKKKSMYKEGSC